MCVVDYSRSLKAVRTVAYKKSARYVDIVRLGHGSVTFLTLRFSLLLEKLSLERLLLAILDRRRLFEVFALFPLANYALFFHHALEALNGTFKVLAVVQSNIGDSTSPPFLGNLCVYSTHMRVHVKPAPHAQAMRA